MILLNNYDLVTIRYAFQCQRRGRCKLLNRHNPISLRWRSLRRWGYLLGGLMKTLLITCAAWLILPCIAVATSIPKTEKTKCYDNTQEITCPNPGGPFYGQDAQYPCNPQSYIHGGFFILLDRGILYNKYFMAM